jgi:Na+/H+-dicarboxylate symporter
MLVALLAGLVLGMTTNAMHTPFIANAITVAELVGGLWLDALRMTIVPLVVALLVTGIAAGTTAARADRLALRSVLLFLVLLWASAILGALLLPLLVGIWPLDTGSGQALRGALRSITTPTPPVPDVAAFLRGIIPANPIAAAAGESLLPLIVFTTVFAFAVTCLPDDSRTRLTDFFASIRDAMLVVVDWVLWIGPLGVFALGLVVGARAGSGAIGALVHYIIIVSSVGILIALTAYGLAVLAGRVRLRAFARAVLPAQAVAISTQSSLASLPTMLEGAERLGVPLPTAGVVLPLAVALFRATSPAMNLAVALYVAHWLGIEPTPLQVAAGVAVAATTTLGSVSLPGQISFFASIAPIALVMGIPLEPLALLVAVETIPDIVRTVGNVSMDVAVTAVAARGATNTEVASPSPDRAAP